MFITVFPCSRDDQSLAGDRATGRARLTINTDGCRHRQSQSHRLFIRRELSADLNQSGLVL
jgi:hypothetical protein